METEPDFTGSHWTSHYMQAVDDAKMHDPEASLRDLDTYTDRELFHLSSEGSGYNQVNFDFPQFQRLAALGEWQAARNDIEGALATKEARDPVELITLRAQAWPWLALAEAKSGDLESARATIAKTRLDCYLCLRVRGDMDALVWNWNGAEYWYASAVKLAPSLPFAYTDRGAMLLWKGDFEGAIANFNLANQKGPHFADPLEMWGEALIAKNRSDLALAKFAEAAKYAPNWGRLHLKWGEALLWSGKRDAAKKQFDIAAALDLSPSEKSELARMRNAHG
jgi:tetratricopeptide (TPR) repeat protein